MGADKKLKVGIDIDGVLVDSNPGAFLKFCGNKLGWKINYEVFRQTHSWTAGTGKEIVEVEAAFIKYLTEIEHSQKPVEGAHDALKKLCMFADIYFITARTKELRIITINFLQNHLGNIPYKEISMDNTDKKGQRIIEFNLDYYIDDSFREISTIIKNKTAKAKIFPFPSFHGQPDWNEIKKDPRILWLDVWQEVSDGMSDELQAKIHRKAWGEIVRRIVA